MVRARTRVRSPRAGAKAADKILATMRGSLIGADRAVETPFGVRRLTYADYTASGRCLGFVEDFIRDEVMPLYGNTHTETSATGMQTTRFREDARRIIKDAVGADARDALIFCGSGTTAAIRKLVDALNLCVPADLDRRYGFVAQIPRAERPVVFVGPYEHHSNELAWRECIADVVAIDEDERGQIDAAQLERALVAHAERPLKIGCFSAASNVTGIITDTRAITCLLHRHGALSCWDFAASAPYVALEMNARPGDATGDLADKDAIFFSPHKFVGGPGSPGVLVVKRALLRNRVPTAPGGGTVAYVSADSHHYVDEPEHREEGGTPAIIESIRAGLAVQLKQAVGIEAIAAREHDFVSRAFDAWSKNPNIEILGQTDVPRLGIVSFLIKHGGRALHFNYVVALLSDLFGIQARGGCSCAGPYAHRLLDVDAAHTRALERVALEGHMGAKVGWARVNFHYLIDEAEFQFIVDAVNFVAEVGWQFMPLYTFVPRSGHWYYHREWPPQVPAGASRRRKLRAGLGLHNLSYADGHLNYPSPRRSAPPSEIANYLEQACTILARNHDLLREVAIIDPQLPPGFDAVRWFPLPREIQQELRSAHPQVEHASSGRHASKRAAVRRAPAVVD